MKIKLICFLLLVATALPDQQRKDYAVFFVASRFDHGWTELEFAPKEVRFIGKELEERYGFEVEIVADATRTKISTTLAKYKQKQYGKNDQLLLFFSMHGVREGTSGFLVPKDGLLDDLTYDSWFSFQKIKDIALSIPCEHTLVAIDACYSGVFGYNKNDRVPKPDWDTPEYQCQERLRLAFSGQKTRKYLTAGGDTRVPAESKFAKRWLAALRNNGGDDGLLGFHELMGYLDTYNNPRPTQGDFDSSTAGDFIFVKKDGCATTVASNDRDGDGVPNAEDSCPDQYGPKSNAGCPPGSDASTVAIDSDYDGIPDDRDACPKQFGTAKANGCPDRDNDGVPDISDKCPQDAGQAHWQGCPDTDSDGIPDHEDACPQQKGLLADRGCPPPDRDGDGVPDKSDKCPDKAGKAYLEGCPETTSVLPDDGLVLVRGGTFTMGCTSEQQDCFINEKPAHIVTVDDFYIGRYEVTQKLWTDIMGKNPSLFRNCDDCPVENVSWNDVQDFLKKLNAKYPGQNYRLPTEAEWEYAARGGGKQMLFGNGKNVANPDEINFDASSDYKKSYSTSGTYRQKTVPVGSLNSPNTLGLYDMSGNVAEWCSDWYGDDYYKNSPTSNPTGPATGADRVIRGGSWGLSPRNCRVTNRLNCIPDAIYGFIGFRLARTK
ncbi:MAG: SUMF1/EgtB/PvdO family nonheme iron enzyme [Saprospiraceae bacterium]